MSRTFKDQISQSYDRHPDAPYWKYRWWLRHGNSATRYTHNRRRRRRAKDALRLGTEIDKEVRDLPWIWW